MTSLSRDELAGQLAHLLRPTVAGGHAVSVVGVGGIGKSTLLTTATATAAQAGVRVAATAAAELTARDPFASVRRLLDHDDLGADPIPFALGIVDEWCGSGPVLLWVDDAHHLDAGSATVLGRLARATRDLPLTVLISARPLTARSGATALLDLCGTQFALAPLDPHELVAMIRERTGRTPGPDLLAQLAVAHGNPFTVAVLLELLDQRGSLRHRLDGTIDVDKTDAAVPESTVSAVRAFLARLPDESTDLLTLIAVLGTPADPADIAALAHRSIASLANPVGYAVDARVMRWAGERLSFSHDLFADILVSAIPDQLRAVMHRDAARILQERGASRIQVAEHAWRGGEPDGASMARSVAMDISSYAPGVAAELLARAQPFITSADTDEVIVERAQALLLAGRGREAEDLVRSYLPRARSTVQRARMHDVAITSMIYRANLGGVHAEIENLLLAPDTPVDLKLELAGIRCWLMLLEGHLEAARRVDNQLAAIHGRENTPSAVVRPVLAWLHGRPRDALRIDAEMMARGDPNEADTSAGPAFPPLYVFCAYGLAAGEQASAAGRAISSSLHAIYVQPFHDFVLGNILFQSGRWDDAVASLDAGLELASETGSLGIATHHAARALIDAHRGDVDAARNRLQAIARGGFTVQFGLDYPGLTAAFLAEGAAIGAITTNPEGDWETAHTSARAAAGRLWDDAVTRGGELWIATIAAYVMRVGDPSLRRRVVENLDSWVIGQMPAHDPVREQVRGMDAGDFGRVIAAAQEFMTAGNPLGAAFAWEESGVMAASSGDSSSAGKCLRNASELYQGLGARLDLYRIRARAQRYGIRTARPTSTRRGTHGWAALTPTEATVADLVRLGLTNPQIASKLFLSPRTVQTHVSHILQKTQLRSRVEIAALQPV